MAPANVYTDDFGFAGSTLFSDILAKDNDKPHTPNSDVHYSIVGGNERGKFSLEDNNPASLLLRNPLDFDAGDTQFVLTILASVRRVFYFTSRWYVPVVAILSLPTERRLPHILSLKGVKNSP